MQASDHPVVRERHRRQEAGLDRPGRYDASSRRIGVVLAFGQPEIFSRCWFRVGWDVGRDAPVELLTDCWRALLID